MEKRVDCVASLTATVLYAVVKPGAADVLQLQLEVARRPLVL